MCSLSSISLAEQGQVLALAVPHAQGVQRDPAAAAPVEAVASSHVTRRLPRRPDQVDPPAARPGAGDAAAALLRSDVQRLLPRI